MAMKTVANPFSSLEILQQIYGNTQADVDKRRCFKYVYVSALYPRGLGEVCHFWKNLLRVPIFRTPKHDSCDKSIAGPLNQIWGLWVFSCFPSPSR